MTDHLQQLDRVSGVVHRRDQEINCTEFKKIMTEDEDTPSRVSMAVRHSDTMD